jgi:hypothetical protein
MKRLVVVFMLVLAFAFPSLAGHSQPGGTYCECNTPGCVEDYPGECGRSGQSATQSDTPKDVPSELGIAIVALLLWLRLKA